MEDKSHLLLRLQKELFTREVHKVERPNYRWLLIQSTKGQRDNKKITAYHEYMRVIEVRNVLGYI